MLVVNLVLFGPIGATIWAVQMAWIPVTAAGIINGIGHYWGYRNFACEDASRNVVPWGILIGGEELHNNHHAYGTSARLSSQWYELDIGWMYIRGLEMLGLAKVRKLAPQLKFDRAKLQADLDTLQAVITHRYAVLTSYARSLKQAYVVEAASLRERARRGELTSGVPSLRRLRHWFHADQAQLPEIDRAKLASTLEHSKALKHPLRDAAGADGAVGAFQRFARAIAGAPAGLVPSRRRERHRAVAEFLASPAELRVTRIPAATAQTKSPPIGGLFVGSSPRRRPGPISACRSRASGNPISLQRQSRSRCNLDPGFRRDDAFVSNRRHAACRALGRMRHLSLVSLYMTCLRATGSNFLISIFSGISFLFLDVV